MFANDLITHCGFPCHWLKNLQNKKGQSAFKKKISLKQAGLEWVLSSKLLLAVIFFFRTHLNLVKHSPLCLRGQERLVKMISKILFTLN